MVQHPLLLFQYTPVNLDADHFGRWTLDAPSNLGTIDTLGKPMAFCNALAASRWVLWIPPHVRPFH